MILESSLHSDERVVLTLDAGGTSFRFSAIRGGKAVAETVAMPSNGYDLPRCLANIESGFSQVKAKCPAPPSAISFAFPGPADYENGIIGDLGNLPGFRGGVALGPMLEDKFGIPVFINNDGDLFTYGEAIAGFLPQVNRQLEQAGSLKRYRNLFGVTLGTGFGGGIVRNGELFRGDNSLPGEIWLMRHKHHAQMNAEEGACIRAARRVYAEQAGIPFESSPDPREISKIAADEHPGDKAAALEAYRRLGEVVGDALGNALTLVDGLAVIGGGLSKAQRHFLPAVVDELNAHYTNPQGKQIRRLAQTVFNLEDPAHLASFLQGYTCEVLVPGSGRKVRHDPLPRIGVGVSRLGTSEAVAVGAYAYAVNQLAVL